GTVLGLGARRGFLAPLRRAPRPTLFPYTTLFRSGLVRCIDCRTALSAEIDGEQPNHSPEEVRAHLRECAECGVWLSAARGLQRLVGVTTLAGGVDDD